MLKIIDDPKSDPQVVPMKDLKPLQVGVIQGSGRGYDGTVVMRTASEDSLEVLNLTHSGPDRCWEGSPTLPVRLLAPGEKITIELSND